MPTPRDPRRISNRLIEALRHARDHGRIVKCTGSAWSYPAPKMLPDGLPEWWITSAIVNALRKGGFIRITRAALKTGEWREAEITAAGLDLLERNADRVA